SHWAQLAVTLASLALRMPSITPLMRPGHPEETEITPLGVEGDYVAPAARDLYFAQEPNLIAPFDFDYETIINFTTNLRWAQLLFLPPAWFSVACCYPCFLQQNVEWEVRSQHVALTVDGIRRLPKALPVVVGLLQDELFARHGQLTPLSSRHARQVCEGKAEINVRPAMHRQGPRKQDCAV
ncbi:unnamed protein product, partial [Effrenium voratum]